jgi:hypothetical protein|tara:strand:+ start:183 stop:419 length:237 start_codon:yes stop_codon:yes gene_type:complete
MSDIRITADEAKRLKNDTAFKQFVEDVRERQKDVFATSDAKDIEAREEAHAVIRALNLIEMNLDAAIAAETFLDLRKG